MLKWDQVECNQQIYFIMLNTNCPKFSTGNVKNLCTYCQGHYMFLSLITPLSSVDYLMWISVRMSWSVSLSVCFTSASCSWFLQQRTNSPASSTSLKVHTQTHSLLASHMLTRTDLSLHEQYRQHSLGWHQPLSGTLCLSIAHPQQFTRLLHWVCISN